MHFDEIRTDSIASSDLFWDIESIKSSDIEESNKDERNDYFQDLEELIKTNQEAFSEKEEMSLKTGFFDKYVEIDFQKLKVFNFISI